MLLDGDVSLIENFLLGFQMLTISVERMMII
jgi:hypothetical protein